MKSIYWPPCHSLMPGLLQVVVQGPRLYLGCRAPVALSQGAEKSDVRGEGAAPALRPRSHFCPRAAGENATARPDCKGLGVPAPQETAGGWKGMEVGGDTSSTR